MRAIWLILGSASLGLAGAGTVLPFLPTTPFVLASAFCFSRSSPALHEWVIQNRTFGAAVRNWQERRAIILKGKVAAAVAMILSLTLSTVVGIDAELIAVQTAVLAAVLTFILTRSTA